LVEIKGMKVKVHYFIHSTEYREPDAYEYYCKERGGQLKNSTLQTPTDPATQQANPALAIILANDGLSFAGFADLPSGALGQTTGNSITLDTNDDEMALMQQLISQAKAGLASGLVGAGHARESLTPRGYDPLLQGSTLPNSV
jgi:hypothetical protein